MITPFVWPWGFGANGDSGSGGEPSPQTPKLQRATPQDGETITVSQTDSVVTLLIEGDAPIETLNVVLPQPGSSRPGQIVRIVTWIDIGNVSFGNATLGGIPSQMFTGDGISLQNIEDNNWLRLP